MTTLEAYSILEAAAWECKQRNIDTPEVREALDLLKMVVRPAWLIPQFRKNIKPSGESDIALEGQQQTLRATMNGIRRFVRELLGQRMDKLAQQYAKSPDPAVKKELERISLEHAKIEKVRDR